MSFEAVVGVVSSLTVTTDILAAIGARLGTIGSEEATDPQVIAAIDAVLAAAGVPSLKDLTPLQRDRLRTDIRGHFRQMADFLDDPDRPPGWSHADPAALDDQGRASMIIPSLLERAAPQLADTTWLLDVGAGAGWLSIAATGRWSRCSVVGIDPWPLAIRQARHNVVEAGLEDRIGLRVQDVVDLDDVDCYDCAWVPSTFLPERVLIAAMPKIFTALRPGGWIVLGRYEPPEGDLLARATTAWRTVRDGGSHLDSGRAAGMLESVGFASVGPLDRTWLAPIGFVIGQKPRLPDEDRG